MIGMTLNFFLPFKILQILKSNVIPVSKMGSATFCINIAHNSSGPNSKAVSTM